MTAPSLNVGPLETDAELERLLDVLSDSFNMERDKAPEFAERVGRDNFRVVRADGRVAGGLAVIHMGQYFGGRSVPMGGISVVGVAPEARSLGAANMLMCETMRELAAAGTPLSCLYPATQTLYRKSGFEQAGAYWEIKLPLKQLRVPTSPLSIRAITDDDLDVIRSLYTARAARYDGNLDRNAYMWKRVFVRMDRPSSGFIVEGDNGPEGYVLYIRENKEPWGYNLAVRDMVASTPAAGRRLLRFLADHRSMSHTASWFGSPAQPLLNLLDEQPYAVRLDIQWMLRLTDVAEALRQRGYPAGLTTDAEIEVVDDVVPTNNRRFTVRISDGRCTVEEGGAGRARFHVRGLAQFYAGHRDAASLACAGALEGEIEHAARLDPAFANGGPWMPDMF